MSKELTVLGTPYTYPETGDRKWGDDASEWAQAITDVVGTLAPPGFIPQTTFDIQDNILTFSDIDGALFDSLVVQSFRMQFYVTRTDGVVSYTETGVIEGAYTGSEWDYGISGIGDSGIELQVTSAGQVQYKSSSVGGTYSGTMTFSATVSQV